MSAQKDWIYEARGPNPPPQPTALCDSCRKSKNRLGTYLMANGQRWCFTCIRKEAPIAL